jgi:hypothetical protein
MPALSANAGPSREPRDLAGLPSLNAAALTHRPGDDAPAAGATQRKQAACSRLFA